MPRLRISLLGAYEATLDGEPITTFGYDKVRALLAYLAVESDRAHRRETLAGLLWPEQPEREARLNLSQALSRLRRAIGDRDPKAQGEPRYVTVSHHTVGFDRESDHWLDVQAFTGALEACEVHAHETLESCESCLDALEGAIALYGGSFLEGFSLPDSPGFEEWAVLNRERLHRLAMETLGELSDCYEARGAYGEGLAHAWRAVELDPWREEGQRSLMRLLALDGQRGAALAQYEVCRKLLAKELRVEPGPETVALFERIRAGELAARPQDAGPPPHNLPVQTTPFIGRERELAELDQLLADPTSRLVTILGPGGIGKTRLALEVAQKHVRTGTLPDHQDTLSFPDGVFFVPLARLSAAEHIAPSVAEALDFRFSAGGTRTPEQQVLDYLREKRMLLILDNFEHLFEGVDLVVEILRTAPRVQVLVTSRERLPVQEEQAFPIDGLAFPTDDKPLETGDYPAVQLFLQAARRTRPKFVLAADDFAVNRICRLLVGMPLGIELAAAWVDVLSLADIAAEIERGLDLLETEWRDVPRRHRSVRAVFDTSWNRLQAQERDAFAQLSVFRGGFTREAAREITGADLRTLARLVDKSLLRFSRARDRYEIHELLRQYGAAKLGMDREREEAVWDRYSVFYCAALGQWGERMVRGEGPVESIDFEADWANVRLAWEVAARQEHAARLDWALDGLGNIQAHRMQPEEAAPMCQLVIDELGDASRALNADGKRVLAKALLQRSASYAQIGNWELARPGIQQSKALLDDPDLAECDTRYERGWLHVMTAWEAIPDWEKARRHYQQGLTLHRELGYDGQVAYRLMNLALALRGLGEYDKARQRYEESLALFRAVGNQVGARRSILFLGDLAAFTGDHNEASKRYGEALALARAQGDRAGVAEALEWMGELALFLGDFRAGVEHLRECTADWRAMSSRERLSNDLTRLSAARWFCGEFDRAYAHLGESLAIANELETPWALGFATAYRAWLDAAVGRYDAARRSASSAISLHQSAPSSWPLFLAVAQGECSVG